MVNTEHEIRCMYIALTAVRTTRLNATVDVEKTVGWHCAIWMTGDIASGHTTSDDTA